MPSHTLPVPATLARRCHRRNGSVIPILCLAIALATSCSLAAATDTPLWFDAESPRPIAREAVELLATAPADGLDAHDYHADSLSRAMARAVNGPPLADDQVAQLDRALTLALRSYLADLHRGRIEPQQLGANYSSAADTGFDPESLLASAIADDGLGQAARAAAPSSSQYANLRDALAGYRELIGNPAWQNPLPPLPGDKLAPGGKYPGIASLVERLRLLGDLPAPVARPQRYEGPVVEAVRSFQERHALPADGVIGKDTLEHLNVSPARRARQLALALERLRWTPRPQVPRAIVVNVPEFVLRAHDTRDGGIARTTTMKVIVGTAGKTPTPLFDAEMRFIEFSPYWNIPPSIAKGETVPRLRRDPGYFDRQGFEFVGSDGRVVAGFSTANLDAVERGQLRLRQRPGANNALGDIKFVFPNNDNIYLHHTPTPQLFQRERRDFSHGCIRVEAPVELAKFVLADEPQWSEERIVQAMNRGKSATIRLHEPLPVVITYQTAIIRNGRVHFFPDIYGQDRILEQALHRHSLAVRASRAGEIPAEFTE